MLERNPEIVFGEDDVNDGGDDGNDGDGDDRSAGGVNKPAVVHGAAGQLRARAAATDVHLHGALRVRRARRARHQRGAAADRLGARHQGPSLRYVSHLSVYVRARSK